MNINDMDMSQNALTPFYLHPRENTGMILITPQLNRANYYSWTRGIKDTLL